MKEDYMNLSWPIIKDINKALECLFKESPEK